MTETVDTEVRYLSDGSVMLCFHGAQPDMLIPSSEVPDFLAYFSSQEDEGSRHMAEDITKNLREYGLWQEPTLN